MKYLPIHSSRLFCLVIALSALGATALIPTSALGYGNEGHRTVGALADLLIAGTNAETHVRQILGTEKLEQASLWADRVKQGNLTPEMRAFVNRNPSHHQYHYTDIPIQEAAYRGNSAGANPQDIVRMIRRCIGVLEGHGANPTNLTRKEALRLLAHYVGDLHQPLHVGAGYFDAQDRLVNPNHVANTSETRGGGWILYRGGLHGYWDSKTVELAMSAAGVGTPRAFAARLKQNPPAGWETSGFLSGWSTRWATEMLPDARQAHLLLTFGPRRMTTGDRPHLEWPATAASNTAYDTWAKRVVTRNLALGGFRLAAVLKRIWP
ncbi:MAG TPA: S1/P1 nuclease [Chthoniobacterales bacterium]|nr:S1/P1 nuclease [Chthoniobacterales bacterium]